MTDMFVLKMTKQFLYSKMGDQTADIFLDFFIDLFNLLLFFGIIKRMDFEIRFKQRYS